MYRVITDWVSVTIAALPQVEHAVHRPKALVDGAARSQAHIECSSDGVDCLWCHR